MKKIIFAALLPLMSSYAITKNVMAPLLVKDFGKFEHELKRVKALGADAVSTDIWWGMVEKEDNKFDWSYYHKLSDIITRNGLKWVPILSTHQCGGNVGDTCDIPIPSWLWSKYKGIEYISEQGNDSKEVISSFATPIVINEYKDLFASFKVNFEYKKDQIQEINVSLGPAGELRYPSYNAHDTGSGYPTRGAIQAYSPLAINKFREYVRNKYQNISNLNKSWGFNLNNFNQVHPPTPSLFFSKGEQHSNYGIDFYDWYNQNLINHGRLVLSNAINEFRSLGVKIGAKIPGIHWRLAPGSDRLAELNAGLIDARKSTWNDNDGHGYDKIITLFKELKESQNYSDLILHFTCLEKDNYEDRYDAFSFAKALVFWIGKHAGKRGVEIKGENALAGPMQNPRSWDNIQDALTWGGYSGITILRMGDVLKSHMSQEKFRNLK